MCWCFIDYYPTLFMLWRSEFDANIFGSFPREGFDINGICYDTSGMPCDISLLVLITGILFRYYRHLFSFQHNRCKWYRASINVMKMLIKWKLLCKRTKIVVTGILKYNSGIVNVYFTQTEKLQKLNMELEGNGHTYCQNKSLVFFHSGKLVECINVIWDRYEKT